MVASFVGFFLSLLVKLSTSFINNLNKDTKLFDSVCVGRKQTNKQNPALKFNSLISKYLI